MLRGALTPPAIQPRARLSFVYSVRSWLQLDGLFSRTDKRYVDRLELAELFRAAGKLPPNFSMKKLEKLVQSSVTLVAGYTLTSSNTRRISKKRLISFSHSTGDGVMVACVERLVVHPEFLNSGALEMTLAKITEGLIHSDVSEILSTVSPEQSELFAAYGYGPDPENSTFMTLPLESQKLTEMKPLQSLKL